MMNAIKKLISRLRKGQRRLYRSGWAGSSSQGISLMDYVSSSSASEKKEDARIEKRPVDVYKEIFAETPKVDCVSLDKKIKLVEKRIKVFKEIGATLADEMEALGFLKARKKYIKYSSFFHWETTNDKLIENLCKKYKVKVVNFESYSRNVPMEAIDELEKFADAYTKVRDDSLILKLIIDDGGKETKKDPILLAASPFGAWWYVLGAWDKEVEIVDDLIYHKK